MFLVNRVIGYCFFKQYDIMIMINQIEPFKIYYFCCCFTNLLMMVTDQTRSPAKKRKSACYSFSHCVFENEK